MTSDRDNIVIIIIEARSNREYTCPVCVSTTLTRQISPTYSSLQSCLYRYYHHYFRECRWYTIGDPVDPVQARCDPCYAQPCHNGGMCISMISNKQSHYMCECSSLYTGDRCQVSTQIIPYHILLYTI